MQRAARHFVRWRYHGGFTLLEMLLAVLLTGIVVLVLSTSLAIAFNAREAAQEAVGTTGAARKALEAVRADLMGVLRPEGLLAGVFMGEDGTTDGGFDADVLNYTTNNDYMSPNERLSELIAVEVQLVEPMDREERIDGRDDERGGRGWWLVRDTTTNLLASTVQEAERQVLIEGVVGWNVRYFDGSSWVDSWDSTQHANNLPLAVELTVRLLPEGATTADPNLEERLVTAQRQFVLLLGVNEADG